MKISNRLSGFTLLEAILVMGVIMIVVSISVLSINPNGPLIESRNEQRTKDVNDILGALYQYSLSHKGQFPVALPSKDQEICRSKSEWPNGSKCSCKNLLSLESLTEALDFKIPSDPVLSDLSRLKYCGTWYSVRKNTNDNHVVVTASGSLAEDVSSGKPNAVISVSR